MGERNRRFLNIVVSMQSEGLGYDEIAVEYDSIGIRDRPGHSDGLGRQNELRCDSNAVRLNAWRSHRCYATGTQAVVLQTMASKNDRQEDEARGAARI